MVFPLVLGSLSLLATSATPPGGGQITLLPGCGANPDGSLVHAGGSAEIGQMLTFDVDNPLGADPVGGVSVMAFSLSATLPCGAAIPGWGMTGGDGELLLGALLPIVIVGAPWSGSGSPSEVVVPIPNNPGMLGATFFGQAALTNGADTRLAQGVEITLAASSAVLADTLYIHGDVHTVDAANPSAEAVAVRQGEIVYVGSDAGAAAFQGPLTQVIDLAGRKMMPGFHDVHMHVLEAMHPAFSCGIPDGLSLPQYVPMLSNCEPYPGTSWVIGYGHLMWDVHQHLQGGGVPPVQLLDQAIPNHPAVIMELTSHSVWVNSLALQAAGIDASTPDPVGGVILRDALGNPNGILVDAAGEMVMDLAFTPTPVLDQLNYDALLDGLALANRNGITSLCDARVYWKRNYVEAYERARDEGTLTARTILGLWAYPDAEDATQIAELASMYSNDPTSLLRCSQVKVYSDGEIEHTTAEMVDAYKPAYQIAGSHGLNYFDDARLTDYITQLEAVGFDFHIHTIGDQGVREALDAVEAARLVNGDIGARHRLTHVYTVHPADVGRFASLDVTPDFQPWGLAPAVLQFIYSPYLTFAVINQKMILLKTMYDSGANVVLSSDFDVGVINPFDVMESAINRGVQSLPDLEAAVRAYTINAAHVMRQEHLTGSIEVGKRADLVVLDKDPFTLPVTQISTTQVLLTVLDGQEIWKSPAF